MLSGAVNVAGGYRESLLHGDWRHRFRSAQIEPHQLLHGSFRLDCAPQSLGVPRRDKGYSLRLPLRSSA